MSLRPGELLIHAGNAHLFHKPIVNGEQKGHGLVRRNFDDVPVGSIPGAPMASTPKIPRSEWKGRIAEGVDAKSFLSHIRNIGMGGKMIPSRDQNGKGYCWAHSSVSSAILTRAKAGMPYADLSAYAIACIIKGFRDEGGNESDSMQFLRERGCPTSKTWPQQSMSRSNDNPTTWAEAVSFKDTRWEDIPDGDFDQLFTFLLLRVSCAQDEDWWSHSICGTDPVDGTSDTSRANTRMESGKLATLQEFDEIWETESGGGYGVRIWNSWGDSWSDNGMGVLTESKGTPNGAMAMLDMMAE